MTVTPKIGQIGKFATLQSRKDIKPDLFLSRNFISLQIRCADLETDPEHSP
jgi:hypothetical protein